MTCSLTTAIKSYYPKVIKIKPLEAASIAEDILKTGSFLFHVDRNIERNELITKAHCVKNIFIIPSSVYSAFDAKFEFLWTFGESSPQPTEEDGCLVFKKGSILKHSMGCDILSSFSFIDTGEHFEFIMKEQLIYSLTERINRHLNLPSEDELLLIEENTLYDIFDILKYGITPTPRIIGLK